MELYPFRPGTMDDYFEVYFRKKEDLMNKIMAEFGVPQAYIAGIPVYVNPSIPVGKAVIKSGDEIVVIDLEVGDGSQDV